MSITDFLKMFLMELLVASPYLIVLAAGFVFALVKYRECPKACVLVAIGTFVLFASKIVQMLVFQWLPYLASQGNMSHMHLGQIYRVIGLGTTIITSAALACILVAVFVGRAKKPAIDAGAPPLP